MEKVKYLPSSALSVLFLVAVSHFNSFPGAFHYDDSHSIVENQNLSNSDIWERLWYDYSVFSNEKNKGM